MPSPCEIEVKCQSDFENVSISKVVSVPVNTPCYKDVHDEGYLSYEAGLYPDLLCPISDKITLSGTSTTALWISAEVPNKMAAGKKKIEVSFFEPLSKTTKSVEFTVEVIPALLPKNPLPVTIWFHCDCIADYYGVEVFSKRHWELIKNFMIAARKTGATMILVPLFTPPLDTEVGGERTTVQCVGVSKTQDGYAFDFENFRKYIALAKEVGFTFFEMSHLFTQWGALHAPKIMVDGEKAFGWETDLHEGEYKAFLDAFLPCLVREINALEIEKNVFFHVSDEPSGNMLSDYRFAKSLVEEHLKDFEIIDALSNFEFYKEGVVKKPFVATSAIEPFLEEKADVLCYYCCCQCKDGVSNRFIAMPSPRTRVIAYQMFYNNVNGFLQWGFNFYNSQLSKQKINPFVTTDAIGAFPSGDAFCVYPAENGVPYFAIGAKSFAAAMQDLRAMQLLSSLLSKEEVNGILEKHFERLTFKDSIVSAECILSAREEINQKINALVK